MKIDFPSPTAALLLLLALSACKESSPPEPADGANSQGVPEEKLVATSRDVLLITSPELVDAWQPLADWKAKRGKETMILSTTAIEENYDGPDLQEKIRLCVRDHIENHGTKWVILGGDSSPDGGGIVPDRDTVHTAFGQTDKDIATDIYYLSATDWDADKDGIYGEFADDQEAISYPDGSVGLGRIPVRTAEDVAAYTEKVISYESRYPQGEFARTIIYTCTEPGAYAKVRRSWDDHVSRVLPEGTMHRYFASETPWDGDTPGDHDLTPTNWISLINGKTAGKLHFHGHGLFHCWVLENDKMFTSEHIDQLTNQDAYPIITTVSCFTGQFDSEEDPCITESMLRAPKAGAVAIVAPCREGKPHFLNPRQDFPLMVREGKMDGTTTTMTLFWKHGIGDELTTGEALMKTKGILEPKARQSASYHMCLAELNLLGDPTLAVHPTATE